MRVYAWVKSEHNYFFEEERIETPCLLIRIALRGWLKTQQTPAMLVAVHGKVDLNQTMKKLSLARGACGSEREQLARDAASARLQGRLLRTVCRSTEGPALPLALLFFQLRHALLEAAQHF